MSEEGGEVSMLKCVERGNREAKPTQTPSPTIISEKRPRMKSTRSRNHGSHYSNLGLGGTTGPQWPSKAYLKKGNRTVLREKQH